MIPTPKADPETGEIVQDEPSSRALVRAAPSRELELRKPVAGVLRPVEEPAQLLEAQELTRQLVAQVLKEGRDYGVVPGTKKKALLQPGAQRTASAFGCSAVTEILEAEVDHERTVHWEKKRKIWKRGPDGRSNFAGWERESGTSVGLYRYVARCRLIHRGTGIEVGEGLGICSSLEEKYVDRPRDLEHTVMRMASKRALVNAVLQTFAMSEQFQDEDEAKEEREELPYEEQVAIARGRYHALLAEHLSNPQIREYARHALQEAHPQLPESSSAWELQHFQRAVNEIEKFGAATFQRAVRWKAQQDPADPVDLDLLDRIQVEGDLSEEDEQLVKWLRSNGVSPWIRDTLTRLGQGKKKAAKAANQEEEKEDVGTREGDSGESREGGVQDDGLPF